MITTGHPHSPATVATPRVGAAAASGAAAGLVGSVFMAIYAMTTAAIYQQIGLFTPIYHVASILIRPDAMAASMLQAANGHPVTFVVGPFLLGAVIHMTVAATYGAAFGVLVCRLGMSGPRVLIAALLWGVIVFALSSCVVLPSFATLFDAGYPVANMASMVGHATFLIEHLVYGVALGVTLMSGEFARH